MNAEKLLRDNQKLIYKLSWKFSEKYGIEVDEAVSIGFETFTKVLKRFDPDRKIKFSTYLYKAICHDLRDGLKKERKYSETSPYIDNFPGKASREKEVILLKASAEKSLSSEAFAIFSRLIKGDFNGNSVLGCNVPPGAQTVYEQLRREGHNWSIGKVTKAWKSIGAFWKNYQVA